MSTGDPGSCSFRVRLTPRADRDTVSGVDEAGTLLVRVTAAPVDGAANAALVRLVARELGVGRSAVTIESRRHGARQAPARGAGARRVRGHWPGLVAGD